MLCSHYRLQCCKELNSGIKSTVIVYISKLIKRVKKETVMIEQELLAERNDEIT